MNKEYLEFLASKARHAPMRGLDNPPELAQHLFDFQRMSVDFALRAGNAGLFLDTGLGTCKYLKAEEGQGNLFSAV